jgi:CO/xanthine dehydrogenase Mo-binding subunit
VKPAPFSYLRPTSLDEACAAMQATPDARVLAGGQTLVPMLAMRLSRLSRPALLIEDRLENMRSGDAHSGDAHGLERIFDIDVAFDRDGRVRSMKMRALDNAGAYAGRAPFQLGKPIGAIVGPYQIGSVEYRAMSVTTNKAVQEAVRGFGQSPTNYAIETMMDLVAAHLGVDRLELRRRNLIRAEGLCAGIGIAACLEPSGGNSTFEPLFNPKNRTSTWMEGCRVNVDALGDVTVTIHTTSAGQGRETLAAIVVGEELGIDPDRIRIMRPDSLSSLPGNSPVGSRMAIMLGGAAANAARWLREQVLAIGAHALGVAADAVRYDAAVAPERVAGLALANTAVSFPPATMWAERADAARAGRIGDFVAPTLQRWLTGDSRRANPDATEDVRAMVAATSPEGYAAACAALGRADLMAALSGHGGPVLLIAGTQDQSTPIARAEEMQRLAPQADLVTLDAAHLSSVEAPAEFAAHLERFAASLDGGSHG